MPKSGFFDQVAKELERLDAAGVSKRHEKVITGFTSETHPKALIEGKEITIFNSNDYLGLRHHSALKKADHDASEKFGTGPGAVRFISGSLSIYRELEQSIAKFHGRDDAMVFSSAFATNVAVIFSLIKGQTKDSAISGNTLVISDELNHRSIIEGIRVANLPSEQRAVFPHMNPAAVAEILEAQKGKFDRVVIVTDGVFSMLGEVQDLKTLREVVDKYDADFAEGVWLVVDDCHGVAAIGTTGRGTEEVTGAQADVLIGTFGKGFGADGGYVVADQKVIDYLRESAATYIYSNSISPATAGAAKAAVELVGSQEGQSLLSNLKNHISWLSQALTSNGFTLAAPSQHPIQPLWIGDAMKSKHLTDALFARGFLVTNISYPVVAAGKDEIRLQLSATHPQEALESFMAALIEEAQKIGLLKP